jgi:dethiobiotin synthase
MEAEQGRRSMKIFIAATRANVGKTTASLGLLSILGKKGGRYGYMKPVGQHSMCIDGAYVDSDAVLFKEKFSLHDNIADMNPITIPQGFTEAYIQRPSPMALRKKILDAFKRVSRDKDVLLVEGTGHAGVGSVIDFSNAHIAEILRLKAIIIAPGGIGNPIDDIMLNKALFDAKGVEVIGVILNKVKEENLERISDISRRGLHRLGVALLGVVPHCDALSYPCVAQIAEAFKSEIVSNAPRLDNVVENMVIGALPPHEALAYFRRGTLLITPGNRDDIVLAAISSCGFLNRTKKSIAGIVLTCGFTPHRNILRLLRETDIPSIMVREDTFTAATRIDKLIVKTRPNDDKKINELFNLFGKHVDSSKIIKAIS